MNIWKVCIFFITFIISAVKTDDNRIVFTDDETILQNEAEERDATDFKIPESVLISMKDIYNVSQFVSSFILPDVSAYIHEEDILLRSGGRENSLEESTTPFAEFAGCKPMPTPVKLTEDDNFPIFYVPTCVRVNRCTGCCTSKRLNCAPSETVMESFKVLRARYIIGSGSTYFKNEGYEIFQLEKHIKCSCQCIVKPEHCTDRQIYRADECSCSCPNENQAADCLSRLKYWDLNECRCRCRTERQCSTGLQFDENTCRCERTRNSLIGVNSRRRTGGTTSNETSSNSILFPSN